MRSTLAALAAMTAITSSADAEPAKRAAPKPSMQQPRRTEVVLASADTMRPSPAAAQPGTAAIKRPAPRVTTCRCGDPQPDSETQEQ